MAVTVSMTGLEAHTIRRYEEAGFIAPSRTEGGQRLYTEIEIENIREISRLGKKGINTEGIRAILAMRKGKQI
jgi:DNA-binding transcriptional MerR regulator